MVPRYKKFEIQIDSIYNRRGLAYKTFGGTASENAENARKVYNSDTIQLWCVFTSPSGKKYKVPGFFNRAVEPNSNGYGICHNGYQNVVNVPSKNNWNIRFSPTEEGKWTYSAYVIDSLVNRGEYMNGSFNCVALTGQKGFVKKQDQRYLMYDNGEPYIPVGQNLSMGTMKYKSQVYCYYRDFLDSIAAAKENFCRLGLTNGHYGLSVTGIYCGWANTMNPNAIWGNEMDQLMGYEIDTLFSFIETQDIKLSIGLLNAFNFVNLVHDTTNFKGAYWQQKPIENGGYYFNYLADTLHWVAYDDSGNVVWSNTPHINPNGIHQPAEFYKMTNPWANRMTKDYLRYIIGRWGYSPSIFNWEAMGEYNRAIQPDGIDTMYDGKVRMFDYPNKQEFLVWMDSVHHWIRDLDCYDRMIVESGNGEHFGPGHTYNDPKTDGDTTFLGISDSLTDIVQTHSYTYSNFSLGSNSMVSDLFYETGVSYSLLYPNKPYFIEEGGWPVMNGNINTCDSQGFDEAHAGLCSSLFCGAIGSEAVWDYGEIYNNHWFHYFTEVRNFTQQSHMRLSQNFKNIWKYEPSITSKPIHVFTISNCSTRVDNMKTADTLYGWAIADDYRALNLYTHNIEYLLRNNPVYKPKALSESERTFEIEIEPYAAQRTYYIQWYSAQTGDYYGDTTITPALSINKLEFIFPEYLLNQKYGDAFFRITKDYCNTSSNTAIEINKSTEEIKTPTRVGEDIIIKAGSTLIISSTLSMTHNKKILIEADNSGHGGRLILTKDGLINGANCFDQQWQGIIVQGDNKSGFDSPAHGKVTLEPGASIVDALTGISSTDGGIIEATGAQFINCSTAIDIGPYEDANNPLNCSSSLHECRFIWTEQILHTSPNIYGTMVKMDGVIGINFSGNYFENQDPTVFGTSNKRGVAIVATDCYWGLSPGGNASFSDNCIIFNGRKSIIKGFYTGILTNSSQSIEVATNITGAVFENNLIDIYTTLDNAVKISDNEFYFDKNIAKFNTDDYKQGIYTNGSTAVRIWQNGFSFNSDSCCLVKINNSGSNANCYIHGNLFSNTSTSKKQIIGNSFEGDNSLLDITCNAYRGMTIDWYLASDCNLKSPQDYWGNSSRSAKNSFDTFDVNCNSCYHIFNNSSNALYYNYTVKELTNIVCPYPHLKNMDVYTNALSEASSCDTLNCSGYMVGIGIKPDHTLMKLEVWPSPAQNTLNIYSPDATLTRHCTLYDLNGRILTQKTLAKGETQTSIDINLLPNGIYFLKLNDGKHIPAVEKIIILKP